MTRVLFVCLGNICRSPTAEGVFRHHVTSRGLNHVIEIDSAGTAAYHINQPADPRAQAAATQRGFDLSSCRGRQASRQDMHDFDYIIAMDHDNQADLRHLAGSEHENKVSLFLEFATLIDEDEVPDPYYGGNNGFDRVIDMIEEASQGLLDHIEQQIK